MLGMSIYFIGKSNEGKITLLVIKNFVYRTGEGQNNFSTKCIFQEHYPGSETTKVVPKYRMGCA